MGDFREIGNGKSFTWEFLILFFVQLKEFEKQPPVSMTSQSVKYHELK